MPSNLVSIHSLPRLPGQLCRCRHGFWNRPAICGPDGHAYMDISSVELVSCLLFRQLKTMNSNAPRPKAVAVATEVRKKCNIAKRGTQLRIYPGWSTITAKACMDAISRSHRSHRQHDRA